MIKSLTMIIKCVALLMGLGLLSSCREYRGNGIYSYKQETYIITHECFICQAVPTITHKRIINEKESIKVYYCQDHLASYILEDE